MITLRTLLRTAGATGASLMALTGTALADGYTGSIKDAPVAPARTFSYTVNAAVTTDYIFRGISQTSNNPAVSAGLDLSYGIFYAGFWGSNVDFDDAPPGSLETDVYLGIKPVWGPVTFDFAVLGYLYPGSDEDSVGLGESNYLELKAGASITPFTNAALGVNVYYSPDTFGELGEQWSIEGNASYTFAAIGRFTPSVSGVVGTVIGDKDEGYFIDGLSDDEYVYWNVGLSVAVDKFTFDVRYWGTDIDDAKGFTGYEGLADDRVVGTIKVLLP